MTRCKVGDLAVIVSSKAGNEGKIVRCVEPYNGPWVETNHLAGWMIDRDLPTKTNGLQRHVADRNLRPIRDNPGNESFFKAAPITESTKEKA